MQKELTPFQIAEEISKSWHDELEELREWRRNTIAVLHYLASNNGGELRVSDLAIVAQRDSRIEIYEDQRNRQFVIRAL